MTKWSKGEGGNARPPRKKANTHINFEIYRRASAVLIYILLKEKS
jgi:hypothetical protein